MSCLVKVIRVVNGVKQQGSSIVFTRDEFDSLTFDIYKSDYIKINDEIETKMLHEIFNPDKTFNEEFIERMIDEIPSDMVFSRIIELGNPTDIRGNTLAHKMADGDQEFTMDELLMLGNSANIDGETIAHKMADCDYTFTVEELLLLGNPADTDGRTVAHAMADSGHRFTVDEIFLLKNPINDNGETIAHSMAWQRHRFTIDEILKLGNPVNNDGWSIARIINQYRYSHGFTDDEKLKLEELL